LTRISCAALPGSKLLYYARQNLAAALDYLLDDVVGTVAFNACHLLLLGLRDVHHRISPLHLRGASAVSLQIFVRALCDVDACWVLRGGLALSQRSPPATCLWVCVDRCSLRRADAFTFLWFSSVLFALLRCCWRQRLLASCLLPPRPAGFSLATTLRAAAATPITSRGVNVRRLSYLVSLAISPGICFCLCMRGHCRVTRCLWRGGLERNDTAGSGTNGDTDW